MIRFFLFMVVLTVVMSCSQSKIDLGLRQSYNSALFEYHGEKVETAKEKFEKIISEHQGTRYAGYSYLLLGDIHFNIGTAGSFKTAEIYYQLFQDTNKGSHLIPYVISQTIILNYLLNESKLMVKHTDSAPYKKSINQYRKFYFFYPKSVYLEMIRDTLKKSIGKLALIEEKIGDWYLDQKLYAASINRYKFILRNYPSYLEEARVTKKLIQALTNNRQKREADEILSSLTSDG